jgi:CTP:molybdopterin cytidylyltransferase MocA
VRNGVGAEDQREVGPREVRERIGEVVAVEQLAHHPVVVDVDGARRVEVLRLQRRRHAEQGQECAVIPGVRIAEADADRLAPVLGGDRPQTYADVVQRVLPRDRGEAAVRLTAHRLAQTVGVLEHLGEQDALRACKAP